MERTKLLQQVKKAKENAPSWEDAERRSKLFNAVMRSFLSNEINLKEYKSQLNCVKYDGFLVVSLEDMMQYPGELGFPLFGYREMVEHEAQHVKAAKEFGFTCQTGVEMARGTYNPKSVVIYRAVTIVDFPDDKDDEFIKEAMKKIASAPGDDMSDTDKQSFE